MTMIQPRTRKAKFAKKFINIQKAAEISGVDWEPFQIEFLNYQQRLTADVKARQIAWSFTAALDAVVDSIIYPGNPHIFVSINKDEAKEKIRYAKVILEAIWPQMRPKLTTESVFELELANRSRLISHPCKPVRGKAKSRIYLDEMGHYAHGLDREIYLSALPATIKGDGYIRCGSTPYGARGIFWEIMEQVNKEFPGFTRRSIPWWSVKALCKDVKMARLVAPKMSTQERVEHFGTDAIQEIFENMFLEDFQQEYECDWVDEATAWIPWDVITQNYDDDLLWWHASTVDEAMSIPDKVNQAILDGLIERSFAAGIDIGRKKDLTELIAVGIGDDGKRPIRISISLDRVKYDDQQNLFEYVIGSLPFVNVLVDSIGIGAQIAENLEQKTRVAQQAVFTVASKELWSVRARTMAEKGLTPLPIDRDIANQIHSIKRKISLSNNYLFDSDRNEKHHADKYWAWALAQSAAGEGRITWPDEGSGLGKIEDYKKTSRWR